MGPPFPITGKRLTEVALTAPGEDSYRLLFESLPIGIYRADRDGRIVFANQFLARLLGYTSPEELLHQEFHLAVGRLRQKSYLLQSFFAQAGLDIKNT